ncbi:MAG: hypothetical protein PUP46_10795 [Endozoicomonas sp. (ex Botrylloides leachii)]|nr:hypothetical protein [Endozoicomonas sp. (ex Botrylloides leachii)]
MSKKIKNSFLKASMLAIPLALVAPQTVALLVPESSTVDPENLSSHHTIAASGVIFEGRTEPKIFQLCWLSHDF